MTGKSGLDSDLLQGPVASPAYSLDTHPERGPHSPHPLRRLIPSLLPGFCVTQGHVCPLSGSQCPVGTESEPADHPGEESGPLFVAWAWTGWAFGRWLVGRAVDAGPCFLCRRKTPRVFISGNAFA